jgi:hypothetical protein
VLLLTERRILACDPHARLATRSDAVAGRTPRGVARRRVQSVNRSQRSLSGLLSRGANSYVTACPAGRSSWLRLRCALATKLLDLEAKSIGLRFECQDLLDTGEVES